MEEKIVDCPHDWSPALTVLLVLLGRQLVYRDVTRES